MKEKLYLVHKEVMAKDVKDAIKREKDGKIYSVGEAENQPSKGKKKKKIGF